MAENDSTIKVTRPRATRFNKGPGYSSRRLKEDIASGRIGELSVLSGVNKDSEGGEE